MAETPGSLLMRAGVVRAEQLAAALQLRQQEGGSVARCLGRDRAALRRPAGGRGQVRATPRGHAGGPGALPPAERAPRAAALPAQAPTRAQADAGRAGAADRAAHADQAEGRDAAALPAA